MATGQGRFVNGLLTRAGADSEVLKEIVSDKKNIGLGLSTQSLTFNDLQKVQSDPSLYRHAQDGFSGKGPDNEQDFRQRVGDKIAKVLMRIARAVYYAKPTISSIPEGVPIVGFRNSGEPIRMHLSNPFLITGSVRVHNYIPFAELIGLPEPLNATEQGAAVEVHVFDATTWLEQLNLLEEMNTPYHYRLPIQEELAIGRNLQRLIKPLDPSSIRKRYAVPKGLASPITYEVDGSITRTYTENSRWLSTVDEALTTSLVMYWDFSKPREPGDTPTELSRNQKVGLFDIDDGPMGQNGVRDIAPSQKKTGSFRLTADWPKGV